MSEVTVEPDREENRTFSILVQRLEGGNLHSDLTQAMQDVVAALQDSEREVGGKPTGSITLALKFRLDGGIVEVRGEVKSTMPKVEREKTVFWATPNNNLTSRNPKQHDLPFRDIRSPGGVPRTA
jgi:hypothetical protein